MKYRKTFLLLLVILPWLFVPRLGKQALRKYGPAALSICTLTKALYLFGEKKRWWRFYKGIPPFNSMSFFNFGPYFVTSLWTLKWTYGNFPLYLLANGLLQIIFIFWGGVEWVSRLKIFTLLRLSKLQYFGIDVCRALSLYGFQHLVELIGQRHKEAK